MKGREVKTRGVKASLKQTQHQGRNYGGTVKMKPSGFITCPWRRKGDDGSSGSH